MNSVLPVFREFILYLSNCTFFNRYLTKIRAEIAVKQMDMNIAAMSKAQNQGKRNLCFELSNIV